MKDFKIRRIIILLLFFYSNSIAQECPDKYSKCDIIANFTSTTNIVAIWENGRPTSHSYFSYSKGVADGAAAYEYASGTISQSQLTPIYFAVDYDASEDDVDGVISQCFQGITDSFKQISGSNSIMYFIGVYGSGLVCKTIIDARLATYSWLAQSTGWRGSKTYTGFNIKQFAEATECIDLGCVTGDLDESPNDNEGSFKIHHLLNELLKNKI